MDKKKVSGFEYAIAKAAAEQTGDKSQLETLYCDSPEQELKNRKDDIQSQFDRLEIKKP